ATRRAGGLRRGRAALASLGRAGFRLRGRRLRAALEPARPLVRRARRRARRRRVALPTRRRGAGGARALGGGGALLARRQRAPHRPADARPERLLRAAEGSGGRSGGGLRV